MALVFSGVLWKVVGTENPTTKMMSTRSRSKVHAHVTFRIRNSASESPGAARGPGQSPGMAAGFGPFGHPHGKVTMPTTHDPRAILVQITTSTCLWKLECRQTGKVDFDNYSMLFVTNKQTNKQANKQTNSTVQTSMKRPDSIVSSSPMLCCWFILKPRTGQVGATKKSTCGRFLAKKETETRG